MTICLMNSTTPEKQVTHRVPNRATSAIRKTSRVLGKNAMANATNALAKVERVAAIAIRGNAEKIETTRMASAAADATMRKGVPVNVIVRRNRAKKGDAARLATAIPCVKAARTATKSHRVRTRLARAAVAPEAVATPHHETPLREKRLEVRRRHASGPSRPMPTTATMLKL